MPCYHPIPAYQDLGDAPILHPPLGSANLELPCGACLGCRTSKALEWARRAEHEASCWPQNAFLTLTYKNEELPSDGHLQPKELSDFIKRLRRARDRRVPGLSSLYGFGLRYLAVGEYGELRQRPHYHLLLFNLGFPDAYAVGNDLLESPAISKLWLKGSHKIGTLTGASANYVAQYTLKKLGSPAHTPDGEILTAPFLRVSKKPRLGTNWLTKYKNDLQHGTLNTNGISGRIPRAYKKQLTSSDLKHGYAGPHPAHFDLELAEQISYREAIRPKKQHNLAAAERIAASRVAQAKRTL